MPDTSSLSVEEMLSRLQMMEFETRGTMARHLKLQDEWIQERLFKSGGGYSC